MFDKILNRSCIAKVMENSGFTFFHATWYYLNDNPANFSNGSSTNW